MGGTKTGNCRIHLSLFNPRSGWHYESDYLAQTANSAIRLCRLKALPTSDFKTLAEPVLFLRMSPVKQYTGRFDGGLLRGAASEAAQFEILT